MRDSRADFKQGGPTSQASRRRPQLPAGCMICPACKGPYLFLKPPGARCRRCGHELAVAPEPDYAGYHRQRFAGAHGYYERTFRTDPQMREVIDGLALSPGQRVLDLGCGTGDYCAELKRIGCLVTGTDRTVEAAKERFPWLTLVEADAGSICFAGASFDSVLCVNTIEHVRDPASLLADVHRILRPRGRLVLTTFDYAFPLHRFLYDATHLWEWTMEEFVTLVASYFTVVDARRSGSFFRYFPANLLLARILRPELLVVAERC